VSRALRSPRPARAGCRAARLTVTIIALAVAGCSGGSLSQNTPQSSGQSFASGTGTTIYRPPLPAPDVSGTTLSGRHLSLASYRGSVAVLNFWASWCGPCRAEAPALEALAARSTTSARFLGIDIQDQQASAGAFDRTFRVTYPSLSDPGGNIALAFRGTVPPAAIPTTLVINRAGQITAGIIGSASYTQLKALISRAEAERR